MNTGRRLLAGAAWIYGAQLVTIAVQFVYAAITSRLIGPTGFGAYAIALSVSGLVTLLSMGGLGQSVARMPELERVRIRSLSTYGLILGAGAAAFTFLTAPLWAWLWGDEKAIQPIQFLAIAGIIGPSVGLATGLMRRVGKFRSLAILTLSGNVVGMIAGASAVVIWHTASALIVSPAIAQAIILIGALALSNGTLLGFAKPSRALSDIRYSGKMTVSSSLSYLTGNIVKLTMTRTISSASFGFWNRAEVVTSIPLQQIQSALIQAVYPEFRHDIDTPLRARVVWTDMLILVSWIALSLSAVMAAVIPPIVPLLFGPGWQTAAAIAAPLAIAGGLQIITTLLASAIEALGQFRWIWSTDAILIALQLVAAVVMIFYRNIFVAVIALIATNIVRHAWQVWIGGKNYYIEPKRLLLNYAAALAFATGLGLSAWFSVWMIEMGTTRPLYWVGCAIFLLLIGIVLWSTKRYLPVFRLAQRYKLF